MKKSLSLAIVITSALLLGQSANALTVDVSGPTTIPSAVTGIVGDLDVYQITINSDDPAVNVIGIDLSILGSLAQVQANFGGGPILTPIDTDVIFGPDAVAQDSHFLDPLTLPGSPIPPPTEGLIPGLGIGAASSGFATDLISNQAAISGSNQSPSVHVAQVVLAAGGMALLTGEVALSSSSTPFEVNAPIGIPEPTTMALAGLGLIGVFSTRRRS